MLCTINKINLELQWVYIVIGEDIYIDFDRDMFAVLIKLWPVESVTSYKIETYIDENFKSKLSSNK